MPQECVVTDKLKSFAHCENYRKAIVVKMTRAIMVKMTQTNERRQAVTFTF